MRIKNHQQRVLQSIYHGSTLKSHRDLDGNKLYQLHSLDGQAETVGRTTIAMLRMRGLIHSNQKFPAATYLLTEKGRRLAEKLTDSPSSPLTARNF